MAQPLGFEGLSEDSSQSRTNNYRLNSESELGALTADHDEDEKEGTVFFEDGERRIDFILTYQTEVKEKKKRTADDKEKTQAKREKKRKVFLENLKKQGVEHEIQASENSDLYFVKIHCTDETLEKGAEELLLRMPIKVVDLPRKDLPWYRDIFNTIKVRDPFTFFDPKIPESFEYKDCFTAPFSREYRETYIGVEDTATFFSPAQRIAIAQFILEKTKYAGEEDQVGISRLLANNSFTAAYPLHDGSYRTKDGNEIENERQLLYREWSHPRNWYKYQPLENIRHYFGEKIGLYFVWVGFYTYWLLWASIVGIVIFLCGLYTAASDYNPVANEICDDNYREYFYMCPLCDETCDFWYFRSGCVFAHFSLLFDYGGTVFFSAFMALWAVLFLEFWKRTESQLQYEWDTLGYEAAEERERPQFVQAIKRQIKNYSPEKVKKFKIYNPVLERDEYVQPTYYLLPKLSLAFSILCTLVVGVIGVVFAVLIYRLAVSAYIYRLIRTLPGGPSAADLITSITGSVIQLIAIIVMNMVYERVAARLTKWELHRTNTEFEDSFTLKMYLFQFINFYSSLFYIGFFKGNFTGYPGQYIRIGSFRLDECPTYGCLFELTIQLIVIFAGKQVLNDVVEIGKPYGMKLFKIFLRRKQEKQKEVTRWEKDLLLIPPSVHGLFFEYIELVIQYGFVTIFVAAFPLAPFCAWLNNVIEIRLDAHKFVQVLRRPVAERAQDIGAWFYLLNFMTSLCVITNAFLIAVTSQFINFEVFNRVYKGDPSIVDCDLNSTACSDGVVAWSTSPFDLTALLKPLDNKDETFFPVYSAMTLEKYVDGEVLERETLVGDSMGETDPVLYLPFFDFECLRDNIVDFDYDDFTESEFNYYNIRPQFQNLTLTSVDTESDGRIRSAPGKCFINETKCRFRGQIDENGDAPLKYWRTIATKLAFVIVFEHVIFLIGIILDKIIPDIPKSVQDEIRREKFLASKISSKEKVLEEQAKTVI